MLRIEEKSFLDFKNGDDFRLELTGAEWTNEMFTGTKNINNAVGDVVYIQQKQAGSIIEVGQVTFSKRTNESAKAVIQIGGTSSKLYAFPAVSGTEKLFFEVPMLAKVTESGDAQVTVDPVNSSLSAGTYKFAVGADGATIATVGSSETIIRGADNVAAPIILDEVVPGSLKSTKQTFRLRIA